MLSKLTKAIEIINYLGLERLPDNGGWFKLIHHDVTKQCTSCEQSCQHANSTTIFYLFEKNTEKRWYRIDATMIWSFLAGDPLEFSTYCTEEIANTETLGSDFAAGHQPLILMPSRDWRIVSCMGQWSLASCICTPGFEIEQLEIAAKGWAPGDVRPALEKYAMPEPLPETNSMAGATAYFAKVGTGFAIIAEADEADKKTIQMDRFPTKDANKEIKRWSGSY